jgi:predicted XRE-type DNA-binding protein
MAQGDVEVMDELELVHGSGNVFRDLGRDNPDLLQAKALLASRIVQILDERKWSTRAAAESTGIAFADFSRIRRAHLGRFTLDRLMLVLARLGQEVEVSVAIKPRTAA